MFKNKIQKTNLKISILGRVPPFKGGISHYNSELCKHLSKKAQVQVISYKMTDLPVIHPWRTQIDQNGTKFSGAKFIFDILNPLSWRKTARTISRFKPDALILHWVDPYVALPYYTILKSVRKSLGKCKIIVICHEPPPYRAKARPFSVPLTRLVLKNADTVFVHSSNDYKIVKRLVPEVDVRTAFHPIYDLFYEKIGKVEAKKELGLKGNVVLFFGYVRRDKGLNFLIDAIPSVIRKVDVTLLIVGEFHEGREKYSQQIKKLNLENKIRIVDRYVSNHEVAIYFSAADVVVTPYVSGSQSGVINIAYAFNKPVITTNVGGFGEIVKDGKTGYVVPSKNSEVLAKAIVNFYRNERANFGEGIKNLKGRFSWSNLSNRILKAIKF